ncbi:MAG: hypothetical protein R3A11_05405 [Bdellovibrionota bacterium]
MPAHQVLESKISWMDQELSSPPSSHIPIVPFGWTHHRLGKTKTSMMYFFSELAFLSTGLPLMASSLYESNANLRWQGIGLISSSMILMTIDMITAKNKVHSHKDVIY